MAAAQVSTVLFAVLIFATLSTPSPGLGPDDRLLHILPAVALLVVGWAWLLRIRRGTARP